jgi:cysteine desulfurase/selenocysteine lyase
MATSEFDPAALQPSGPLDVVALSELANRMFRALPAIAAGAGPGSQAVPAAEPGAPAAAPASAIVPPAPPKPLPSVGGFGVTPGAIQGAIQGPIPAPAAPPASVPQARSVAVPSGLEDGRSAARSPTAVSGIGVQFPAIPGVVLPPAAAPAPTASVGGTPDYYFLEHALKRPAGIQAGIQVPGWNPGPAAPEAAKPGFDVNLVRRDFPILEERVNGRKLVWLDNAATTQKPNAVIERLRDFYRHENSNIHRAAHELAARATDAYEGARESVRRFLNARSTEEIVFVRGATEAINLVAQSWGRQHIGAGDEIIVSWLEHHANIVPWQQLCALTGAKLRVIPVDDSGQVRLDQYAALLGPKTKLVAFTQVSNALGTVTPAQEMAAMAHAAGACVLIDGAQAVSHMPVDVQSLGADFYVFSGHKVFGPTGIGVVYGRKEILNATQPWQGGGNMIRDVTFEHTQYQDAPARFEAGTGNIADAVGLGAALDYVTKLGMPAIAAYEHALLEYGTHLLQEIPGLRLIGTAKEKAGVLSFVLAGHKTEEIGAALNREGIAVRSGHHCAQPILRRFGLEATVRPSLSFYNTFDELDLLAGAVRRIAGGKNPV